MCERSEDKTMLSLLMNYCFKVILNVMMFIDESLLGFHRIFVHTWRLKPRHLVEQLRHFFIGGGPQLQEDFFPLSSVR